MADKEYKTYGEALQAAQAEGLTNFKTKMEHKDEDGIFFSAQAEFAPRASTLEGGQPTLLRVYMGWGHAGPMNNTEEPFKHFHASVAETRAKSRVLRDALGWTEPLKEEMDSGFEYKKRTSEPATTVKEGMQKLEEKFSEEKNQQE